MENSRAVDQQQQQQQQAENSKQATQTEQQQDTSVRAQVLAIPELLESILLELPPTDILVNAQRVSKDWKANIDASVLIQQTLFLKPIKGEAEADVLKWDSPFTPLGFRTPSCSRASDHPALGYPALELALKGDGSCPEASWRKMLCSQPPVKTLEVREVPGGNRRALVEAEKGIKVGELVDALNGERGKKLPVLYSATGYGHQATEAAWRNHSARSLLEKWEEERKRAAEDGE